VLPEQFFQSEKEFPVILVLHGWGSTGGSYKLVGWVSLVLHG
jgi:hypothetical protein